jgi:ribosome biogenesis protein MAK21
VSDRYYRALYSKLLDQELQGSPKQALFLNVLYKSLRSDPEISRLKAFLKRIFQICGHHTPPFICGCLLLISEILKTRPALKSFILSPEVEDEEEHFSDVPLEEEKDEEPTEDGDELENVAGSDREEVTGSDRKSRQQYRGLHRNPLFCGAEHTCLWELERLSEHYHPSVQVFAQVLLKGDYITYPGDPLQDFTLTRFLDRFMFKNPKQKVSDHGGSVMQNFRKSSVATAAPVNTPEFVTQEEDNVREDEKYLYKFFRQQQQLESSAKTKKEKVKKEKEMDSLDDIDVLLGKDGDLDSVDFTRYESCESMCFDDIGHMQSQSTVCLKDVTSHLKNASIT